MATEADDLGPCGPGDVRRLRGLLAEAYRELSTIEAALARPGGEAEVDALLDLVTRMRAELDSGVSARTTEEDKAVWHRFFQRRCPQKQDVINSAATLLVLRDAEAADLRARVGELSAECKALQLKREELRAEITRLECGPRAQCAYCKSMIYGVMTKPKWVCPKCGSEVLYG